MASTSSKRWLNGWSWADARAAVYEAVTDNSLDRRVDSDDIDYVMRRIREYYIAGTSCSLVFVGNESWGRKYIDWEIKSTLDKQHGLIGVQLPTLLSNSSAHSSSEQWLVLPCKPFTTRGLRFIGGFVAQPINLSSEVLDGVVVQVNAGKPQVGDGIKFTQWPQDRQPDFLAGYLKIC
ncbi:TIR domain-containing protein [Staphylococcus aureus]|uniref:TIR domain-containing protein n=1 Tax=Staphylococcus aureus TaxID=1280 RepID=UPI001C12BEF5